MNSFPKVGLPIIIVGILVIVFVIRSSVIIAAGKSGVLYKPLSDGVVLDMPPLGEGFHIVAPWNQVTIYEMRKQQLSEQMEVLSSNGLEIRLDVTAIYHPKQDSLGFLHKNIGEDYVERILKPVIRSASRSVVGRYTPEQLYSSKRDDIQREIMEESASTLQNQFLVLEEILVRDITLPANIKEAIEKKLSQEQEALEYEFRLEKAKKEAERQRIEAEGKAQANEILNKSLTANILKEKGIEATLKLAESPNAKIIVIGSGENSLPIILGQQ